MTSTVLALSALTLCRSKRTGSGALSPDATTLGPPLRRSIAPTLAALTLCAPTLRRLSAYRLALPAPTLSIGRFVPARCRLGALPLRGFVDLPLTELILVDASLVPPSAPTLRLGGGAASSLCRSYAPRWDVCSLALCRFSAAPLRCFVALTLLLWRSVALILDGPERVPLCFLCSDAGRSDNLQFGASCHAPAAPTPLVWTHHSRRLRRSNCDH